jgi:hypothetical protein
MITLMMSIFLLAGCTDKEEKYKYDQNNLQKIINLNKLVEDTYSKVRKSDEVDTRSKFGDYCDKIVKEAKKINVKTKEGKALKEVYIEKIEYSKEYLMNNWNDTSKPLMYDQGLGDIDGKLSKLANQFLNKKEEVVYNKMEVIYFIFGIIVGTIGFILLNKFVDIYYFGCSGITMTWAFCVGISTFVIAPIVGELLMWVIGIVAVIVGYKAIKDRNNADEVIENQ